MKINVSMGLIIHNIATIFPACSTPDDLPASMLPCQTGSVYSPARNTLALPAEDSGVINCS